MTKFEIQQFAAGHYGVVMTTRGWFGGTKVRYLDLSSSASSSNKWRAPGDYTGGCFSSDLRKVQIAFMECGHAPGVPIVDQQLFDIQDVVAMNKMAVTDEGLKDLMLKAKEFYLLKKK